MEFKGKELEFYNECLEVLKEKHGDSKFYLAELESYVFAVFQRDTLMKELAEGGKATIKLTNHSGHTNDVSNPKVRMFALYNEQAIKLSKALGLQLATFKAGRKPKRKGFNLESKLKIV
jgi:hypothetical protein